ncbi:MAG: PAS domain-containing sensor histidine kinase [Acidobacteria bacterium]|nr:MAG: PAS domain-containing sensor histidine kinase [Acidobacteriota bacterium]
MQDITQRQGWSALVHVFFSFLSKNRKASLGVAALLIAAIAILDWRIELNISLGTLYLFPMLIIGACLTGWQIALAATLCVFLNEQLDPFPWMMESGVPRIILTFTSYFGTALFVSEVTRRQRQTMHYARQIERESELRRQAEEQMQILIESSPAAILTIDSDGAVLLANSAAHQLLGLASGTLPGRHVADFLPEIAHVPSLSAGRPFRTVMQCRGRRNNGEMFVAGIWFSTYRTASGPLLTAIVLDASQDLRDREEFGLRQLMATTRILVGTVSHEIRNLCGAIRIVYTNLSRKRAVTDNEDFHALGTLVEGLEKIASIELRQSAEDRVCATDLQAILDELKIIIEPSMRESGTMLRWEVPPGLPEVWADRESLLQVFLNLTQNSERAMREQSRKELIVQAFVKDPSVLIRFRDTGPGVAIPERLFTPFQADADATGLGLYVSRALLRNFDGDLRHEPHAPGCSFVLELRSALKNEGAPVKHSSYEKDSAPLAGRPHPVS